MNIRILRLSPKAQDKGDSRRFGRMLMVLFGLLGPTLSSAYKTTKT